MWLVPTLVLEAAVRVRDTAGFQKDSEGTDSHLERRWARCGEKENE